MRISHKPVFTYGSVIQNGILKTNKGHISRYIAIDIGLGILWITEENYGCIWKGKWLSII